MTNRILEEPAEPHLSRRAGQAGHRELPPPPPPSEYPLRVIVEQEEGAENEITGKVEEPEEGLRPTRRLVSRPRTVSGPSSKTPSSAAHGEGH